MHTFTFHTTPFARPDPGSFDAAAQVLSTTPTAGPPLQTPPIVSPDLDARGNPLDSPGLALERCCSPFSDAVSSCSTAPSIYSPGLECDEPTFGVAGATTAPARALAQRRRSFARRTASRFQEMHPTAHALVLNFDASTSRGVQTTGSRMYAARDAFHANAEDEAKEAPTVFDSVAFSPGEGQADERFDVYLCQSGRFSLGEVANDDKIWGFSSPQWEKVGPYVFFEHVPLV